MPPPRCPTVHLLLPSARAPLRGSLSSGRESDLQYGGTPSLFTTSRPHFAAYRRGGCGGCDRRVVTTASAATATGQPRRPFHTSSRLRADVDTHRIDQATNHYEILNLPPSATPAEIKNSFYKLSKTHHPDVNRTDADRASERFVRISDAYKTLSQPDRRSAYDRSLGLHTRQHRAGASYYSGGGGGGGGSQAGGRPATGLSRRRTTFRGPPPSFYRSGGWGAHSAKRAAAHEESTGGAASGGPSSGPRDHHNDGAWAAGAGGTYSGFAAGAGGSGGMGPGQDPFRHRDEEVPHFDRESHQRTGHRTEQHRLWSRRVRMGGGDDVTFEPERSATGMFFVIGGVLALSVLAPFLFSRVSASQEPKKKDWSKRTKG